MDRAAAFSHQRDEALGAHEDAIDIDRHDPPPVFQLERLDRTGQVDPGIVDQDVARTVRLLHMVERARPVAFVGHVGLHVADPVGQIAKQVVRVAFGIEIADDHGCAIVKHPRGSRMADSAQAPGDESNAAREPARAHSPIIPAVLAPSMVRSAPEINAASSDPRNDTRAAISSTSPMRLSGDMPA